MTSRSAAPGIGSIWFAFPGSRDAIRLRDPVTDEFLGSRPEWAGRARAPAAYAGGARPAVRVVLTGPPGAVLRGRLSARGTNGPGVAARIVSLTFDKTGSSAPVTVRLERALPKRVGARTLVWRWMLGTQSRNRRLGTSRHRILTTWRAPQNPRSWLPRGDPGGTPMPRARHWSYAPIVEWTCDWAAGRDNPKAICDAIIANLGKSRLKYFVSAHDVRDVLLKKGGMCGGFYKLFQAMAGAQGVFVHRRCYMVDWRVLGADEARWCAIVVTSGGLGHRTPPVASWTFHDVDAGPLLSAPVKVRRTSRYCFFGAPGLVGDGHCVNILEYEGSRFLYDASFGRAPVRLRNFRLPSPSIRPARAASRMGDFKAAYLDAAVAYMMGSVRRPDGVFRTILPGIGEPAGASGIFPGLTVRTSTVDAADGAIDFFWGP